MHIRGLGVSRQVGLEGISQHEFESSFLRVADNTLGVTGHIHESGRDTASWREGFYDDATYRESTFTESDHSERLVEKRASSGA